MAEEERKERKLQAKWSQDKEELESAGEDNKRRDKKRRVEGTGVKDGSMYSKLISPDWNYSHCNTLSLSVENLVSE